MSTEVIEVEKTQPQKVQMSIENGNYTLTTFAEQLTFAKWLIANKLVSESFKTDAQLVIAVQLCKDLNLPNSALSNFYVVGGKPAIYGDVLIGLVMGSGFVEDKKIEWFDEEGVVFEIPKKDQKYFGCRVQYKRKGFQSYIPGIFTADDKDIMKPTNQVWVKYWKDMFWRRADIRAIKATFPDCLKGIDIVEYLEEIPDNEGDIKRRAKEATAAFSDVAA